MKSSLEIENLKPYGLGFPCVAVFTGEKTWVGGFPETSEGHDDIVHLADEMEKARVLGIYIGPQMTLEQEGESLLLDRGDVILKRPAGQVLHVKGSVFYKNWTTFPCPN